MKTKVAICIGLFLVASVVVGARIADPAGRMKSATIRFAQAHYYDTDELCPIESPAEQFDEWRHAEKRDILAISLGEEPLMSGSKYVRLVIGELSFIDVLHQIPEKDWPNTTD